MIFIKAAALLYCVSVAFCVENDEKIMNVTSPKDMYVVRATVYTVGILTNKTNDTAAPSSGHQEAITIYHNNGSNIDLSALPAPLLTNVTAEKMVGVAPADNESIPWDAIKHLTAIPHLKDAPAPVGVNTEHLKSKRDASETPVEIVKGTDVIPPEVGVQSIALPPPLLTLNKNLSRIPVPIPNISVVSYAKVNTLVKSP